MKRLLWFLAAVLMVSIGVNVWQCSSQPESSVVVERDTVWKDTTIYQPVAAETIQTGRVVYVKIPGPTQGVGIGGRDTVRDTIEVALPVVQKRYDDSLYTAWVSGFEPQLDSIRLHQPEITTTVTRAVVKDALRFGVGVHVGAGYGLINRQADVFVGVGVSYRLW